MKQYALILIPLSIAFIATPNLTAAPDDLPSSPQLGALGAPGFSAGTPGLDLIGQPGPPVIPPGQLKKIELPPPGSPVPIGLAPNLLAPDAIFFLAPDGQRTPPGQAKSIVLPEPSEVF